METNEELWREYGKWTAEYVKAKEALDKLLPTPANLSKGEQMTSFVPTEESLAEYDKVRKRMNRALRNQRRVLKQLHEQSSQ